MSPETAAATETLDPVEATVMLKLAEYIDGDVAPDTDLEKALDLAFRRQAAFDIRNSLAIAGKNYDDLAAAKTPQALIAIVRNRLQPKNVEY